MSEDSPRDLWDNSERTSIRTVRVPEGEEREKGHEKILEEIIAEKFLNMGKEIVNQVQEAQRVSGRINPKRETPRHTVIKLTKITDKDKVSKATWENNKQHTRKLPSGNQLISQQKLQGRREWNNIFKVMKGKNLQPGVLYPARLSF